MKIMSYHLSLILKPLRLMSLLTLISISFSVSSSVNLAPPSLDDPYYLGQLTYHKKLACGTCPLSKTTLDAETAKDFIEALETNKQFTEFLTKKERSAVAFYVNEFFAPRR